MSNSVLNSADAGEETATQSFSIPSKISEISENVVKSNLTQDNSSTSDLTTQKDPSKLNANDFAKRTKWTTAGWTRSNSQYIAKSSKMTLNGFDKNNRIVNSAYVNYNLDFIIDKNDLTKGRKVLVASVQDFFDNLANSKFVHASFDQGRSESGSVIVVNNQTIGHLSFSNTDDNESDIYFISDVDGKDLVNDLTVNYKTQNTPLCLYYLPNDTNYKELRQNGVTFPANQHIVTNSGVYTNDLDFPYPVHNTFPDPNHYEVYADAFYGAYGYAEAGKANSAYQYVIKLKSTDSTAQIGHTILKRTFQTMDKDNKFTDDYFSNDVDFGMPIKQADNLTALDLLNNTSINSSSYSKQSDGSYLISVKTSPSKLSFDENVLKRYVSESYFANYREPGNTEKIIDNTLNYNICEDSMHNFVFFTFFHGNQNNPSTIFFTDVTPGKTIGDTHVVSHTVNGVSTDVKMYRHANVSYIDDTNGNTISIDFLTGRENTDLKYTVTILQGYLLNNPQNGINYKWNVDHSQITYTFQDDQKQNEANPIVIHLTHKHSKINDPKQLINQSTRTFTIVYSDKHVETIKQVIGLIRICDLDEATNTPTYTPWTLDDASKSYVTSTVNGKTSNTDRYVALDPSSTSTAPRFASITLPRIAGYTAEIKQNKINPAMFMVSFVAAPTSNTDHKDIATPNDSKSNHNIITPDNTTKHDIIPEMSSVIESDDKNVSASDWQIKGVKTHDYLVSNGEREYELPIVNDRALNLIKTNDASLAFNYIKLNTPSDYVFVLRRHRKMYQLDIKKQNGTRWQTVKTLRSHNYKSLMKALSKLI